MRIPTIGFIIVGLLAGCSADQQPQHRASSTQAMATQSAAGIGKALSLRARSSFASLPDRGDLVAYDPARKPHKAGAYTWHPVQLSEEHALHAIGAGRDLVVSGPDGQPIRLQYDRHIEHDDGNWTWIGRTAGGQPGSEAIVTFGEKAAFGTIPYGDRLPLRLNINGGNAWLVETDKAVLAKRNGASPHAPDFIAPPTSLDRQPASAMTEPAAQPPKAAMASASLAESPIIDILLGYSSDFSIRLGGASQVNTRLNFIVDVANQAYANSQIPGRIRLVHTMQVNNYADATSNSVALEDMGDPARRPEALALQPLIDAQNQYGADLVSLVRTYHPTENGGCGMGYLLGAGQKPINETHRNYGLSVVSDSVGTLYSVNGIYCADESLAHEIGHNMGSTHDIKTATGADGVLDAKDFGTYPYSFGYTTAASNFKTVMAYGDSGQTLYRVFSNPRINYCGGNICGIEDQADNARSLEQTMPIVAAFRATMIPTKTVARVRNDVDGDGKSDLLWFNPTSKLLEYWLMNGATKVRSSSQAVASGYSPLTTGDYNGDGRVDLILRNGSAMQMWLGNGSSNAFDVKAFLSYPSASGWTIIGSGDVDADSRADLLLFNPSTSRLGYWVLNGAKQVRTLSFAVASGYSPLTSGDYNGDGRIDIVLRHTNGAMQLWTGDGTGFTILAAGMFPAGWTAMGSGDVNGDGKSDLLWYHPTRQKFTYWMRNGASTIGLGGEQSVPAGYTPLANGDLNGDGRNDISWKPVNGAMLFWLRTGSSYGLNIPQGWSIVNGFQ